MRLRSHKRTLIANADVLLFNLMSGIDCFWYLNILLSFEKESNQNSITALHSSTFLLQLGKLFEVLHFYNIKKVLVEINVFAAASLLLRMQILLLALCL